MRNRFVGLTALLGALPSCDDPSTPVPTTMTAAATSQPSIDETLVGVLAQFNNGNVNGAIDEFITLAEQPNAQLLCAYGLSEDQFARLPDAERESLGLVLFERTRTLREFGRIVVERAHQFAQAGERDQAKRYLMALQKCGQANSSPNVVVVGQLGGNAIAGMAAEELAALDTKEADADK